MEFRNLHPLHPDFFYENEYRDKQLGKQIKQGYREDMQLALIGIISKGYDTAANTIRKELFAQYVPSRELAICDMGNYYFDDETQSFEEIEEILQYLYTQKVVPVCFGSSEMMMYALQQSFAKRKQYHSAGIIHSTFRFDNLDNPEVTNLNYLMKIYDSQDSHVLNFLQLGLQRYFIDPQAIQLQNSLHFDTVRLGEIRNNIKQIEPYIRDIDVLGISINAVRYSDSTQSTASPNGLFAEELAQLMRYAGMSDQVKCLGFFDYKEENKLGAQLFAQAIWCFLDAFSERKNELPNIDNQKFQRFIVQNEEIEEDLVFLKSPISGRWWIEMPRDKALLKESFYISCNHADYETALDGDLPECWLKGFHKLNP